MDKMKLYDELVNVERQLETMLFQVKEMKPIVDNLVEENLNLKKISISMISWIN